MKRILGRLTQDIIEKYELYEHKDKKIVIYDNDRKHCERKHSKEFKDNKTFHYVMDNLEYIIENPDHVFYIKGYDEEKNKETGEIKKIERYSLEYYKDFDQDITVRVRIDDGRELKVKTVFPVDKEKISHKIQKEINDKYIITEEEYEERKRKKLSC